MKRIILKSFFSFVVIGLFSVLLFSVHVFAAKDATKVAAKSETKTDAAKNPFEAWAHCPKNKKELVKSLGELNSYQDQFFELSADQWSKVLVEQTWRATYAKHLCSFMMPESVSAQFAKSCWAHYESIDRAAKKSNWAEVKSENEQWVACLKYTYEDVPTELKTVSNCIDSALGHK